MANTFTNLSGVIETVIDGNDVSANVVGGNTSHGINQDCGTATVHIHGVSIASYIGKEINIYANSTLIFNGTVLKPSWSYYSGAKGLSCADIMRNITRPWGGSGTDPEIDAQFNRVYENQLASAVRINVCEAMAVPVSLHSIITDAWTLGTTEPVVLRVGQTALQLIRSLDELEGHWTASRANGAIYNRRLEHDTPVATFTEGSNILNLAGWRQAPDGIINKCIIYGLQTPTIAIGGPGVGEYAVTNVDIPDPPKYQPKVFRTNLVEADITAADFAERYVDNHNFRPENWELTIAGESTIQVGDTVTVNASTNELTSSDRFVAGTKREWGNSGFLTKLSLIRAE